tara:strand:+ start:736 stop:1512 length:777 start_codon:yes stop_codon:yes gene_type:complete
MMNRFLNCTAISFWVAYLIVSCQPANGDNEIYVTQTGDNLRLGYRQAGDNNMIDTVLDGYQLDTDILQEGNRNEILKKSQGISGDYNQVVVEQWNNTNSTDVNKIWIDIDGDNNAVDVGQGCKFYYSNSTECSRDTHEDAGHNMEINIDGSNNGIRGGQKAGSANPDHDLLIDINSDNNSVFFTQAGSGAKDLDLTINNDGNAVSIHQHYGSHNATVTLDGTSPTSLSLIQTGGPSKSYNLIQNCLTIGGCSVSVTQN